MFNKYTHAIMAIDPGGTTGVAAGYVVLDGRLVECFNDMPVKRSMEIKGDFLAQGRQLGALMKRFVFKANVENMLPLDNIHIAIEDFVLRRRQEGGATGNLTSCW